MAVRSFFVPPAAGAMEGVYGFTTGGASGFVLAQNSSAGAWAQPVTLTGVSADGLTVQLNITWINPASGAAGPAGGSLYYAWGDYPQAMPLVDAVSGLPVAQFNISIPTPARRTNGTCTARAGTDGTSGGFVVPGSSAEECCALCWADARCTAAAFDASAPTSCWMKYTDDSAPKAGTVLVVLDL